MGMDRDDRMHDFGIVYTDEYVQNQVVEEEKQEKEEEKEKSSADSVKKKEKLRQGRIRFTNLDPQATMPINSKEPIELRTIESRVDVFS